MGVYSPVGVDKAMLMSAEGRIVSDGFGESGKCVMELRKIGHSSIAFERVLRRMGKYVSFVYC